MPTFTVISESGTADVDAHTSGDAVLLRADALNAAIGWQLKPEGLCRDDLCVPVALDVAIERDGFVDLVAVAALLQRPIVVDADAQVIAIGVRRPERRDALVGKQLPSFELPDVDGSMHSSADWRGRKTLLAAFASW